MNAKRPGTAEIQRMFRRKPAPDLIRGGYRFADKNMRHSVILEHVPIPKERNTL